MLEAQALLKKEREERADAITSLHKELSASQTAHVGVIYKPKTKS